MYFSVYFVFNETSYERVLNIALCRTVHEDCLVIATKLSKTNHHSIRVKVQIYIKREQNMFSSLSTVKLLNANQYYVKISISSSASNKTVNYIFVKVIDNIVYKYKNIKICTKPFFGFSRRISLKHKYS